MVKVLVYYCNMDVLNHTRTHRAVHHRTIHFTTSPRHYSQQQAFAQSTSLRAPQAISNK